MLYILLKNNKNLKIKENLKNKKVIKKCEGGGFGQCHPQMEKWGG